VVSYAAYAPPWSVTDNDRRQTPASKTILATHSTCSRASNNHAEGFAAKWKKDKFNNYQFKFFTDDSTFTLTVFKKFLSVFSFITLPCFSGCETVIMVTALSRHCQMYIPGYSFFLMSGSDVHYANASAGKLALHSQ